ncbi:MAG: hypothetical protein F2842_01770 [Actinobacteria bacterium]|uniref:Unannotated protein n=1 Tax=freshwater metagenome TaxID=449393 RepID=A0A6J7IQ52_9ZZZZ|nr:hypothetical protein [Actinomycetota bacterium]MSW40920.1 hypothetical protein [Actinomycetota bacterium]
MTAGIGAIIAAVVGGLLAFGASSLLVSSQTTVPSPVDKPYVVYGNQ